MVWQKLSSQLFKAFVLGYIISTSIVYAEIIGNPPYKTIKIPTSKFGDHFSMEIDSDKTLYIAYENGIKIYDGARWSDVFIGQDVTIRRLYFNHQGRVYFGGSGIIGYVYRDEFGMYQFKDITPKKYHNQFADIWHMSTCNDDIVFISLHNVFIYNQKNDSVKSWDFAAKLGDGFCSNNRLTIQDREVGLKVLTGDIWQKSPLSLDDNRLIDKFLYLGDGSYFILSQTDDWRLLQNNQITHMQFEGKLPHLDTYVTAASLGNGKFVMGTSDGLLTFLDINSLKTQSFQLTNEWISKILSTKEGDLIILTEFEIYYLQWPSAIRLQGKDTGIASSLFDIKQWNNQIYIAGSAGVYLEDKQQLLSQNNLFHRLNWTNHEAWFILPLNQRQALLAESHKIVLIEDNQRETKTTPLSDTIYPRELIQSRFNPNLIYVITELDSKILFKENDEWNIKPLYPQRANSIIEDKKGLIYMTLQGGGFYQIRLNTSNADVLKINEISTDFHFDTAATETTTLLLNQDKAIIASNSQGIFELKKDHQPKALFTELMSLINQEDIDELIQGKDGLYYGFSAFNLFYQDLSKQWHLVDMSQYLKGVIDNIALIHNEIKILSNGILITYLTNKTIVKKPQNYTLRMTKIQLKQNGAEKLLPVSPESKIDFEQGDASLSFAYVLNDVKNSKINQYRFKLSEENSDWSDFSNNTKLHISNLSAGNYSLDIQAKDSMNKIYTMPTYHFNVNPPWYLTQMAKIIWAITTLLALGLLFNLLLKWREKIHEAQKIELKHIIDVKTQELKQVNINLQKMAHLDGLTGLSNRFYLDEYIKQLTQQITKNVVVMMMDMDEFKKFNDENGHIAGDELLKKMAHHLSLVFDRGSELVARYGGEEFLVILVDCELQYAQQKAERIRQYIDDKENKTSVSIGICESSNQADLKSLDAIYRLIDKADQALYDAKNAGRNKIILCQETFA